MVARRPGKESGGGREHDIFVLQNFARKRLLINYLHGIEVMQNENEKHIDSMMSVGWSDTSRRR